MDALPLDCPNGQTHARSLLSASGINEGMKTGMVGLSSCTAVEKRYDISTVPVTPQRKVESDEEQLGGFFAAPLAGLRRTYRRFDSADHK